jgi:mRNA interferase RelE/StbE
MKAMLGREAQKQLDRLNEPLAGRIAAAIEKLEHEPPEGDVKPLKGQHGILRLRVGNIRILFYDRDNYHYVFRIAARGGVYRGEK